MQLSPSKIFLFIFLIIGLSILGVLFNKKLFFFILIFCIGYFYVGFSYENVVNKYIGEINEEGVVLNVQDNFEKQKVIVELKDQRVLVYTDKDLSSANNILIKGEIVKPENFDNFNYIGYLAEKGISGIIYYPEIEIVEERFNLDNFLKEKIVDNLSIKKASILMAMLLGDKGLMNSDFKQDLSFVGVSHVVAISGMHMSIIAFLLLYTFMFFRIGKNKSILLTILFLFLYVILIGFPASALRAFIMITLVFIGGIFNREVDVIRTLIIAGTIILIFNPLALVYDLGFQLSFLAVLGIVLYNHFFNFKFISSKYLRELISVTLSAQVFIIPILILNFGYISLSFLIVNILIIPIIPMIIVLGIISLIIPFFFYLISIILEYFILIINIFSNIPVFQINCPFIVFIILYIILLYIGFKYRKRFEFYFLK
jgi:competence protein ComEC